MATSSTDSTHSTAESGVDMFMCAQPEDGWMMVVGLVIACAIPVLFYKLFRMHDIIKSHFCADNSAEETEANGESEEPISNIEYLKESLQLSEKMLSELSASILSFEKNHLRSSRRRWQWRGF